MIKYFIRHYWRYLAMALAFATISFFINSCEVKAEGTQGIELESISLNHQQSGTDNQRNIYNNSNGVYKNWGRTAIYFTLSSYVYSTNASTVMQEIYSVTATANGNVYTCDVGNNSLIYNQNETMKGQTYSITCDVYMGSGGLTNIKASFGPYTGTSFTTLSSTHLTAYKNIDDRIYSEIQVIANNTNNINNNLLSIYGSITDVEGLIRTQTAQIMASTNAIVTAITGQTNSITNAQNQTTGAINDVNDSINDSSVDDPNSDLSDMQDNEISNSVISDLLLLPINMFENIVSAIGGTCSSFPLGELLGTSLVLPCINISSLIGQSLWNVIDILFCGIFVLSIRKKFVDIFENITSLKDRGNELE